MMTHPGSYTSDAVKQLMARAMFYRVVCEVLGIDDDDLLMKALDGNGIVSLHDLLVLTDYQIDTLSFDDGMGVWFSPCLASRNKIRILRSWHSHLQLVQGTRDVNWMDSSTVNEDEWDDFRVGVYVPAQAPVVTPTPRAKSATSRVSRAPTVHVPTPAPVSPDLSLDVINERAACSIGGDVSVDGELVNGELDTGEAIVFGSDDVAPGPASGDVFMLVDDDDDAVFEPSECPWDTFDVATDCRVRDQDDSELFSDIGFGISADCCAGTLNAKVTIHSFGAFGSGSVGNHNAFDFRVDNAYGGESNVVFDPGGRSHDVFEWDVFFGCDWFTPAPEQYLNLLLLDRGE